MKSRLLALPAAALLVTPVVYETTTDVIVSGSTGTPHGAFYAPPPASPGPNDPDGGATGGNSPPALSPSPTSSLIGQRCSLPESGPGSLSELAGEPLGTAALHIPALSDVVGYAQKANLMDTVNSTENVTVFAPTNDALQKMSDDERRRLTKNREEMRKVVNYHVVDGRLTPDDLEKKGDLTTRQGGKLHVTPSGDTLRVDGAQVLCGNIQTKNATLYLIDSILKPGGHLPPEFHVKPEGSLVASPGGPPIPGAARLVLEECDRGLRAGENEALARSMDNAAKQAAPGTIAVSKVCSGVAKINAGRVSEGLMDLHAAEQMKEQLPNSVRRPLEEMMYSAQVVGNAAVGDEAGVRRAIAKLSQVDPKQAEQYVEKCEALKPTGSRLPCEPSKQPEFPPGGSPNVTPAPSPSSPSGEPAPGTSSPQQSPKQSPEKSEEQEPQPPAPEPS